MSPQLSGSVLTDPGRQRTLNEDWCGSFARVDDAGAPAPSAWVVADGVGGFGTGREASTIAVDTILAGSGSSSGSTVERDLIAAFERAHRELLGRATANKQYASTVLAAVIHGSDVWVANLGNCRAYLIRDATIRQVTRDHTWVAEQVALGKVGPAEAVHHPKSNVITRCLGQQEAIQPDIFRLSLQPDDRLVLSSDGLTRHVSDAEILQRARAGDPAACARALVDLANDRGGTDNVTVGVLEFATRADPGGRPRVEALLADMSASKLAALQAMSQRINANLNLAETLRSVMDSLVDITGAERGFVMLANASSGELEFQVGRNLDAEAVARDRKISRTIVGQVFSTQKPLLIGDAMEDPAFRDSLSVVTQSLRSVMCAPLLVKGQSIGVAYVDNSLNAGLFNAQDLGLVIAFANMASTALENARLHERLEAQVHEIDTMKTAQDRILRSVSSGILAVDQNGIVQTINRAAAEMLAVSADQAPGRRLDSMLPERFMMALGPPLYGGGTDPGATVYGLEMEGDLPGRGYIYLRHRLSPMHNEHGATVGWVLVLDDVTERKRLEREGRQAAAEREKIKSVFENFMAPAVFNELMSQGPDRTGIGGDRRDLTILFADIRGFTGMSEKLPPEQVVDILNDYLSSATDVIFDNQGTIDKFIGDAIMALFGAPVQLTNHPLQAVQAALAMQRRFAESPPRQGSRASFGVGINTGSGIVGTIGAPKLKSYTVIGDVVNVAARLQSEARAGEVLVSGDTYERIADALVVEELGSIYVKGRTAPVNVYKVISLRT